MAKFEPKRKFEIAEKLQKVLARAGLGSRRELERWIASGRVSVNGQVAHVGQRVVESDKVRVDGREILGRARQEAQLRVLAYHKPTREITSRQDEEGRPTVFDTLPRLTRGRWIAVGRLDFNTTGLLLFSNSGELVHRLMHPSAGLEREYAVRVLGEVPDEAIANLRRGVLLDGVPAAFKFIEATGGDGANRWFRVVLDEGRNREVRRLWETQGITVSRLTRVRYGTVALPRNLPIGRWMDLKGEALKALLASVDLSRLYPGDEIERPGRRPKLPPRKGRRPNSPKRPSPVRRDS